MQYSDNIDKLSLKYPEPRFNCYFPLLEIWTESTSETKFQDEKSINNISVKESETHSFNSEDSTSVKHRGLIKQRIKNKFHRSKAVLIKQNIQNQILSKQKIRCCYICFTILNNMFKNRNKVVTFKGPKEEARVQYLLNIPQNKWYRPEFQKLLELYSDRMNESNYIFRLKPLFINFS